MGRGVSVASGAFAVAYKDVSDFGYRYEDEEGKKIDNPEYDEDLGSMDWEDFILDIKECMKADFPSFEDCDKWVGNEDHAILENRFAYFGVSEYCGLVSMWLVLKDGDDYGDEQRGLKERWAKQVTPKFEKRFGELRKLGTFSNGESVYERIKK